MCDSHYLYHMFIYTQVGVLCTYTPLIHQFSLLFWKGNFSRCSEVPQSMLTKVAEVTPDLWQLENLTWRLTKNKRKIKEIETKKQTWWERVDLMDLDSGLRKYTLISGGEDLILMGRWWDALNWMISKLVARWYGPWMIAKNPVSYRILGGGFANHLLINVHSQYVFWKHLFLSQICWDVAYSWCCPVMSENWSIWSYKT